MGCEVNVCVASYNNHGELYDATGEIRGIAMNREQLGYFIVAYQLRSFAEAAARVPMSVQGFNKSIRTIETELGVTLFENDGHGMRAPTAYADELYKFAEKFESDYEMLLDEFDRVRSQERNVIRLGTSLGIIGLLGPDFLTNFHANHPNIRVEYDEIPDILCDKRLVQGAYDMTLMLYPYEESAVTTELYSSKICFWVRDDDVLTKKERISPADFAGRAIAMPGKEIKVYWRILAACEQAGIELEDISTSSEIFWIYNHTLCGKGPGFCVEHLIQLPVFARDEAIKSIPFDDMKWRFGVSYLPTHRLTSAEQTFYDYCVAYAQGLPRFL